MRLRRTRLASNRGRPRPLPAPTRTSDTDLQVHIFHEAGGLGNGKTILSHPLQVQSNRFTQELLGLLNGRAGSNAPRQIGDVRRRSSSPLFRSRWHIVSWHLSLEARLLQYTIERARRQIIACLSRNRDSSRLDRMLELPMTASRHNQSPSVRFQQIQDIANRHMLTDARQCSFYSRQSSQAQARHKGGISSPRGRPRCATGLTCALGCLDVSSSWVRKWGSGKGRLRLSSTAAPAEPVAHFSSAARPCWRGCEAARGFEKRGWIMSIKRPRKLGLWVAALSGAVLACAILVLLPAIQHVIQGQRWVSCVNNLEQIGLALNNYYSNYGSLPPAYLVDKAGRPTLSWRVLILPYLNCNDLYSQVRFDEPWNGPHNIRLASLMPPVYRCPADAGARGMRDELRRRRRPRDAVAGSEGQGVSRYAENSLPPSWSSRPRTSASRGWSPVTCRLRQRLRA